MNRLVDTAHPWNDVEMFRYCEQCGRCSSACPLTGIHGFNVRRMLRHVELDLIDEIAASPMPWFCAVCGRCEEACPNGIRIIDITRILRVVGPADRVPDGAPCTAACPAGIDVPGYLRRIAAGDPAGACGLIMDKAPFPGVLGRVCPHPCEEACKRGPINAPLSICAAKRYAADHCDRLPPEVLRAAADTGRRVAIIGSGPAGLTAAFYLRRKGHRVTVFEARAKAGGMMRYGIPAYRLPEAVLDREIDTVLGLGIELKTGQKLGTDFDVEQLRQEGFEAVFIAVGAQLSKKLPLGGADLPDVLWGVDFLAKVREGRPDPVRETVLVVGGGNVAIDVALSALRLGAKKVVLACLEKRAEMPANHWEIEQALEEGVEMLYSWGPERIIETDGTVSGADLVRCLSVFDDQGLFCPFFDETRKTVSADQVILAVGQSTETAFCRDFCFLDSGELVVENGLIAINPVTQQTGMRGVYAGGDAANGPGTVVEAIAAGRRAAASIDRDLGGDGQLNSGLQASPVETEMLLTAKREPGFADRPRQASPVLGVSERRAGFDEIESGFSDQQARTEAGRCLHCDLECLLVHGSLVGAGRLERSS